MQPRINQGRTYGGGGNGRPPPIDQKSDRNAGSAAGGGQIPSSGTGDQSGRASFLSQADLSRSVQDSRSADPRIVPSRTSNSTPAAAGVQHRPSHSEDLIKKYTTGDTRQGAEAESTPTSYANVNNADRPRGILKTTIAPTSNTATNLKASQSKVSDKAAEAAAANPLLGQTVIVHGLQQPIKSLPKTLEALRAGKPWQQAFQSRDASTWIFKSSSDAASSESSALNNVPQLSVYFPLSAKKEQPHKPAECDKLCNGAPHVDRAPICRFCLARIAPRYKEKMVFNARECLDHLQNCPGIPKVEDRKLLYEAFRKADERFIDQYHTSGWKTGLKQSETSHAKPMLPPKARPQSNNASIHRPNGATSAPMGRKTSSESHAAPPSQRTSLGSNALLHQEPGMQASRQSYQPIAAKQLPNNIPTMPAAMRRDNIDFISQQTNSEGSGPLGSAQPDASGWGVSTKSATYDQHIAGPDTMSEKDELEDPQHDPEDGFAWQAVREKLNNAPLSNGPPNGTTQFPNNNDSVFFGAEIISQPKSAPNGQPFIPLRHVSVPSPRPESSVAYRGPNGGPIPGGGAGVHAQIDPSLPSSGRQVQPGAAGQSAPALNTSTLEDHTCADRQLFRSPTPPSSRHAKTETTTPRLSEDRRQSTSAEMQNIPEPELPAEEPWDLVPDPAFGHFFASQDFVRSGAPSLASKTTSRPLSRASEADATVSQSEQRNQSSSGKRKTDLTPPLVKASSTASNAVEVQSDRPVDRLDDVEAPEAADMEALESKAAKKERKRARRLEKARKAAERAEATVDQEAGQLPGKDLEQENTTQREDGEDAAQTVVDEAGRQEKGRKPNEKKKKKEEKEKKKKITARSTPPRERSPSVELVTSRKPTSSAFDGGRGTQANDNINQGLDSQTRPDLDGDDEDDNVPLRSVASSHVKPLVSRNVVEISSSGDESEATAKASQQRAKPASKNKAPLGPVAKKTLKSDPKGKYKHRASSHDLSQSDVSSLSDSDSDCVKVTSVRVVPSLPRPIPYVEVIQPNRSSKPISRNKASTASSSGSYAKRTRAPTPSDPSESESEAGTGEPTASQIAASARRFQRFAGRDRSPEEAPGKSSKGKGKKKKHKRFEDVQSQPRIVRRKVGEADEAPSSPASIRQRKRKAKVIHTSDEDDEEGKQEVRAKRLKTYEERQSQLASLRNTQSREGSHASGSSSMRQSDAAALGVSRSLDYFPPNSGSFFVDVQKNVDNVLYLPAELDPWVDIFEAADILNLDTLRDCIRKPENADEFVKWVLARTGRKMPLAKQFPMVQAIQQVLSNK